MTYIDYLTDCFTELEKKQSKLEQLYEINSFTKWEYDNASGILTLTKSDKIINFRYYIVGTYSKELKTWKWSQKNSETLKNVELEIIKIKSFGIKNNFENLVADEFATHEEIGWELSSICINLIGGIGVYRPFHNETNIHLVLTEFVDIETAENEKSKYVDCENHDRRRRAFVCQHLTESSKNGFEESFESYENMEFEFEDDDFIAWCNKCEQNRLKEGGLEGKCWEEAQFKIVCEKCYFKIKESNS
jgi:hypothetical protein